MWDTNLRGGGGIFRRYHPGGMLSITGNDVMTLLSSLWTEWLTDRCKSITFSQLRLQAVMISVTYSLVNHGRSRCRIIWTGFSGLCSFCRNFVKLRGAPGFWENVLNSFSYFYIEFAYWNFTFCGAYTLSFLAHHTISPKRAHPSSKPGLNK